MKSKEIRIISLLVLDTIFFLLEVIVGYSVHSLALVADSFHMLNDIISLLIALWAVKVKDTKPADGKYTYGWQRAEILGALINAVFLLALCFTIVIEAIQRLVTPPEISSPVLVLVVGFAGLASNLVGLVLFHEHGHSHSHSHSSDDGHDHEIDTTTDMASVDDNLHDHEHNIGDVVSPVTPGDETSPLLNSSNNTSTGDFRQYMPENVVERLNHSHGPQGGKKKKSMNMEGVFLHVLGDALGNVGVIIAALIIWKTNWSWKYYSDPLISLIITVIIFSSALPLCKKSSTILLQASPTYIDSNEVVAAITELPTIKSVHDFHLWNLNEDILIASLHIELSEDFDNKDFEKIKFVNSVAKVREVLHKFNIHSATIQPEFYNANGPNNQPITYGSTTKLNCSLGDAPGYF